MNELRVEHLVKKYRSRTVVKDVSFAVGVGEIVGLLGPNGAGKTTCFYMTVGLVPSDGGNICMNGMVVTKLPIHQRSKMGLAYLPQEASIFRRMTVYENILSVMEINTKKHDNPEQEVRELLEELHIGHLRDSPAIRLSGGERRRVEIARALATKPKFILLDEPFAGVDPIAVMDIQQIIRFLKNREIGVLITDHNVRETLGICDRSYIINQGEVLASGKPEDVIQNDSVRRVYLGEHFKF